MRIPFELRLDCMASFRNRDTPRLPKNPCHSICNPHNQQQQRQQRQRHKKNKNKRKKKKKNKSSNNANNIHQQQVFQYLQAIKMNNQLPLHNYKCANSMFANSSPFLAEIFCNNTEICPSISSAQHRPPVGEHLGWKIETPSIVYQSSRDSGWVFLLTLSHLTNSKSNHQEKGRCLKKHEWSAQHLRGEHIWGLTTVVVVVVVVVNNNNNNNNNNN